MIKRNYRLWGIILVLAIATVLTTSFAFASDLRLAVEQNKPVLRGNPTGQSIDLRGSTNISKKKSKDYIKFKKY